MNLMDCVGFHLSAGKSLDKICGLLFHALSSCLSDIYGSLLRETLCEAFFSFIIETSSINETILMFSPREFLGLLFVSKAVDNIQMVINFSKRVLYNIRFLLYM